MVIKKEQGEEFFKKITTHPRGTVIMIKGKVQSNDQVTSGFEVLPSEMKTQSDCFQNNITYITVSNARLLL